MNRYKLSPRASRDLDRFKNYLLREARPEVALSELDKLEDAFGKLSEMPGMGSRREHLTAGLDVRFWSVSPYVVVYRDRKPLEIVRVFHERQNIADHLERVLRELGV